jgi:enamine deaminase RidA (YjgF/YER057c/UK114 family)
LIWYFFVYARRGLSGATMNRLNRDLSGQHNCWHRLLCLFIPIVLTSCAAQTPGSDPAVESVSDFSITRVNPATMVDPALFGYTQVVTVTNGTMVYLAGQGPTKLNEKSPGPDDLRGQARNAVDNILLALDAVGAGPENVVYLRINVVDYNPKMLIDIAPELKRLSAEGARPPASVFVGVSSLVLPSTKIEIETVAALP